MARRLRELLSSLRAPARAPTLGPSPRGGHSADTLRESWSQPGVLLADIRSPGVLAHGIVVGSWLVDPAELLEELGRHGQISELLLLVDQVGEGTELLRALQSRGVSAQEVVGLSPWQEAGAPVREPAWKSPLPVRHRVAVSAEHLGGLAGDAPRLVGTVQDVHWPDNEFTYDVLLRAGESFVRVHGLVEEQLESLGPRGAAGMGETL